MLDPMKVLFLCKKYNKYHYTYTNTRYHSWDRNWIHGTTSSLKKIKQIANENNKSNIFETCPPMLDIKCSHYFYEKQLNKKNKKKKELVKKAKTKSQKITSQFLLPLLITIIGSIIFWFFIK